jgi:hypothetical protein
VSNAVYPAAVRGLTWTVLKTGEFNTLVQDAPNKYEVRIAQSQNPIWHFALMYDYIYDQAYNIAPGLTYTDLRTLMGFFLARQGQFDDFLFDDPSDDSVGPAMVDGSPNTQAELQVVTDGAGNWYSPLQRNMGGQFYEDVTDLNTTSAPLTVYANGVLQPDSNYTVMGPGLAVPGASFMGLYLKWNAQPATPVTAQFNFYFRVRWESDEQDFEEFMYQLWTIGGSKSRNGSGQLKLMSARPNQA